MGGNDAIRTSACTFLTHLKLRLPTPNDISDRPYFTIHNIMSIQPDILSLLAINVISSFLNVNLILGRTFLAQLRHMLTLYFFALWCLHYNRKFIFKIGIYKCRCTKSILWEYLKDYTCSTDPEPLVLHTYIHTYIHTYAHTYIHAYIHTYKHKYIHKHIHKHIHTYIHT